MSPLCPLLLLSAAVRLVALETLPAGSSVFNVRQSWSQWPDGYNRKVYALVSGSGGPVTIVLHGRGGRGEAGRDNMIGHDLTASNGGNNVMLFPDGHDASWNILHEPSKADDVRFIEQIVDQVSNYSNVNLTVGITLLGYSNGCSLINNIFISSDRWEIQRAVCGATALSMSQYREGTFYKRAGPESGYDLVARPLTNRTLWVVQGVLDDLVPWRGGYADPMQLTFHSATDSISAWAALYGSADPPVTVNRDYGKEHSYLNGRVKLHEFSEAGHDLDVVAETHWTAIRKQMMELATGGPAAVASPVAIALSGAGRHAAGAAAVAAAMWACQ